MELRTRFRGILERSGLGCFKDYLFLGASSIDSTKCVTLRVSIASTTVL